MSWPLIIIVACFLVFSVFLIWRLYYLMPHDSSRETCRKVQEASHHLSNESQKLTATTRKISETDDALAEFMRKMVDRQREDRRKEK